MNRIYADLPAPDRTDRAVAMRAVIFCRPESGFAIASMQRDGEVGILLPLKAIWRTGREGQIHSVRPLEVNILQQATYGHRRTHAPSTIDDLCHFLADGAAKGTGEKMAERIREIFGTDPLRIFDEEPEHHKEIKGTAEDKLEGITHAWAAHAGTRTAMMILRTPCVPFGIAELIGERNALSMRISDNLAYVRNTGPAEMPTAKGGTPCGAGCGV
jgi:hypothetical protein